MMIIAIDPGVDGAIAILGSDSNLTATPMNLDWLVKALTVTLRATPVMVVVEKLTGTGNHNPFAMVQNYGEILGILRAVGIIPSLIPPQVWQKGFDVSGMPYADRKKELHRIAKRYKPNVTKPLADAVLIAQWAGTKTGTELRQYCPNE